MAKRSRRIPKVGLHQDLEGNVDLRVQIPPEAVKGIRQTIETVGSAIELADKVAELKEGPVGQAIEVVKGILRFSAGKRK